MVLSRKYNFDNLETEAFDADSKEDISTDKSDFLVTMDYSLPESTSTTAMLNTFSNDSCEKYMPSTSKISMISENQTTENFLKEFDCFYTEMMGKVKGLKDAPALKNSVFADDLDEVNEYDLFKNIKQTPEIQAQLENIKKLDDEINSVISEYNAEKEERLQTQYEMCNEISQSTLTERDAELFLNLCQFEFSDDGNEKLMMQEPSDNKKEKKKINKKPNDFILRNIYLAKEGAFANSSLTDEEKYKLEELLDEDDECETSTKLKNPFTVSGSEPRLKNAYQLIGDEVKKIEDIDCQLEKFKLDEEKSEKNANKTQHNGAIEIGKLNSFMLDQRLKQLESNLKKLHRAEKNEQEKLKTKIESKQAQQPEGSDSEIVDINEILLMNKDSQDSEDEISSNNAEQLLRDDEYNTEIKAKRSYNADENETNEDSDQFDEISIQKYLESELDDDLVEVYQDYIKQVDDNSCTRTNQLDIQDFKSVKSINHDESDKDFINMNVQFDTQMSTNFKFEGDTIVQKLDKQNSQIAQNEILDDDMTNDFKEMRDLFQRYMDRSFIANGLEEYNLQNKTTPGENEWNSWTDRLENFTGEDCMTEEYKTDEEIDWNVTPK